MDVKTHKAKLRNRLIELRNHIDSKLWAKNSRLITENLKSLDVFKSAKIIHCYVSMNDRNEVETQHLIQNLLDGSTTVLIPVTNFKTGELKHHLLKSFKELEPNKWGVLEPVKLDESTETPDIIVVPLLAADINFNRLGYGKGFYDRFLKNSNATKIGLVFDEFVFESIPVEKFDEKLDIIITQKRILE